jgi:hypothetical protein
MKRSLLLSLLVTLALPAHAAGRYGHHKYLFVGKVTDIDNHQLQLTGPGEDGKSRSLRFVVMPESQWTEPATTFKRGDEVVVDYDYTLNQGELKMLDVHHKKAREKVKIMSPIPQQR